MIGIGGIFLKASDPGALHARYEKHLGIQPAPDGSGAIFPWREAETGNEGMTVWSVFKEDTRYFAPGKTPFMINYRVEPRRRARHAVMRVVAPAPIAHRCSQVAPGVRLDDRAKSCMLVKRSAALSAVGMTR